MDTTFDITKIDEERLSQPASWKQVKAISFKFAKLQSGKINWQKQKRIYGCMYNLLKEGKLSFKEAHVLLSTTKTLPKKYEALINVYLEANPEA
tara:strand:- start:2152 stop:2433 length:282 start_codon:yes stop_codon:yes gene_type:complete